MTADEMTADEVVGLLGLVPLPGEGGLWAQTWLDENSSAIYYLLRPDDRSRLHRLGGVEIYHHYAGAPALLTVLDEIAVERSDHRLGPDLAAGERPTAVVPAGVWQGSTTLGEWSLLGTTMAPPFASVTFELAARADLLSAFPADAIRIAELTD